MIDDVNPLRPRTMSVAYGMLGSVTDAVGAFVRDQTAGGASAPEEFLIRTTTRLCIERQQARRRR